MFESKKKREYNMAPGLTKLNIKPQQGSLNAMKASFASASRAQGVSYGIMAQRSIFSTDALVNPKAAYSPAIASIRGQLNPPRPMMFAGVMPHQCHNSGDDTMNKFMMGMMALNMVAEMTKNVTAGIKDIKATRADRPNDTETVKPKVNQENDDVTSSSVLSQMSNANDSTALSAAIDKAKDHQNKIPQKLQTAKSDLEKLQGQEKQLEQSVNEAQANLDNHINTVIPAQKKVVEGAKQAYNGAKSQYDKLQSQLTYCKPEERTYIESQIATAKTAMENAKTKLDEEQAKLDKLNKGDKEALEGKLKDAKDEYEAKQKEVKAKDEEIKTLQQEEVKLKTEIPKQKKRLEELKNKDEKEIKSSAKDIQELEAEIKKLDQTKDAEKIQKKQSKLEELKKKKAELEKRQAIAKADAEIINGQQFKEVKYGSETLYLINGKEVSQEFYNTQKNLATV